ncbi:MAG: glycosyltransferase family 39 protein [Chloroflexi bacterium]|nr:glycosyltransferase family 39 protein [Chloroflexota bacterium]
MATAERHFAGQPGHPEATFARPGPTRRQRAGQFTTVGLILLLTAFGLWIRLDGLTGWDGTLSVDEARLALAARGVREHGLPRLPSGWIYTRGLLATYAVAPSFALLGETDFAARFPSTLAGAALIPVAFLLGREVAGRVGALFVAGFVVGHPSLVVWSRQAWFYALYVLLYSAALLFIVRAHRHGRPRDQLLGGALVGLTLFTQELGIFLVAPLGLQVAARLWATRRERRTWLAPLGALTIVGTASLVLWVLVTTLRASSLVGAYGEVAEYVSPHADWSSFRFYGRMLLDGPGLLLLAALLGLPLAIARRRLDTAILWFALLVPFVHAVFIIPRGPQERYGLTLLVVLAVLAAQAVQGLASAGLTGVVRASGTWPRWSQIGGPLSPTLVTAIVLLTMLAAHQNIARAVERAALSAREGSWLRAVRAQGIGPDDLVMTDVPTVVGWYVGGVDFWVSSKDFEKYTTYVDGVRADVHTGAVLIRTTADFDRLVAQPYTGHTLWVIGSGRSYQWGELLDDDVRGLLERRAAERISSGENVRILRHDLRAAS